MTDDDATRLNEYDREEWWDVCRKVCPTKTREQFNADWEEFQVMKARELERRAAGGTN